jgi:hypothetical protein
MMFVHLILSRSILGDFYPSTLTHTRQSTPSPVVAAFICCVCYLYFQLKPSLEQINRYKDRLEHRTGRIREDEKMSLRSGWVNGLEACAAAL